MSCTYLQSSSLTVYQQQTSTLETAGITNSSHVPGKPITGTVYMCVHVGLIKGFFLAVDL